MANYFVDSTTGDDGDSGLTMDLAWATLEYAVGSGGVTAGDIIWVRRLHSETPGGQIASSGWNGIPSSFIQVLGWPRALDASITSATWTNGSTTVDLIVGLSMGREEHVGRFITGPNGFDYLITKIVDSNTILIDRKYSGATVTGTSGAATIQADTDYSLAQAIDDSGWTINVAAWTADADNVPLIDFGATAYYFSCGGHYWRFANLEIKDGTSTNGLIYSGTIGELILEGLLLSKTSSTSIIRGVTSRITCKRCIITGSGSGASQWGVYMSYGALGLYDCAIYNMGDSAILPDRSFVYLDNVNLGIEDANGDEQFYALYYCEVVGRNIWLDESNGVLTVTGPVVGLTSISIENYGKVFGVHKEFTVQGTRTKLDVIAGSGDPYKRSDGANSVVEILYDKPQATIWLNNPVADITPIVFTHEFEVDNTSKNYRYYVQAEGAVLASELWIEIEYVSSYDGTTQYTMRKIQSDEAITQRTGADDWSQYIEVTGIQPAVHSGLSKVIIKCYCSYYHATNKIYIDPNPEIT